jgi:hypothetical protein
MKYMENKKKISIVDEKNEIKIELQHLKKYLKTLDFYERSQFLMKEFDIYENSFLFQDELVSNIIDIIINNYEGFSEYKNNSDVLMFEDFISSYDYLKMYELLKGNGLKFNNEYYIITYMNSGESYFNLYEIDSESLFDTIHNEYIIECRNIKLESILD